jgi:hypothetical protein
MGHVGLWLRVRAFLGERAFMNTERIETPAERELTAYRAEIRGMKAEDVDLDRIEREIRERLKTVGREMMADAMKQADTSAPEVDINGERWGNRRFQNATYQSIFGAVDVGRSIYQQAGRGRVAVPMDLRLGIVEGAYTPLMARVLTRGNALMPDEEAAGFLGEVGFATVSSSTFSRIPRSISARYERNRHTIEAALREQDVIPEGTATVQAALDGVMVPQDGEHAKPRGRKTDSPDPPRHEQRYGVVGPAAPAANDGAQGRSWHEASVATLAFFDAEGKRLKTTYVGRMPEPGKATTVDSLEKELMAVVSERPDVNVVFASDGAAAQWTALAQIKSRLPAAFTGHSMDLVDAFHVAEYVQLAANAIEGKDPPEARILAATWRATIKEKDDGPVTVLHSMRARLDSVATEGRLKDLKTAIGYIANQNDLGRMQYAEAARRNYPIGTGITEAAGKTIIGTRMKRAGARFSQHGGQTVMTFRAALLSHRFEALHRELHATYTATVKDVA